jgi:hypothetical protein
LKTYLLKKKSEKKFKDLKLWKKIILNIPNIKLTLMKFSLSPGKNSPNPAMIFNTPPKHLNKKSLDLKKSKPES